MHNDTVFTSSFSQPVAINRTRLAHLAALAGVLLLAVFLHFYRLEQEGYANLYYAAAVKSMLTSWHNFFFVSFDSGGFVTVDKPPLGLWIQAASAWVFGFSGWSLLLPQALAGVLSVGVLYHLVQRTFGPTAGLLAALLLTLTPISIAANRNNTMDSQLVLVVLLAAWAMMLAAEQGNLRWLLVSMFLVGVGFNIKMLQAFLVLPALYLLYFVAAPRSWWQKIWHLGAGTAVLLTISLSWAVVVDGIPASERPFIGSSQNNTVMELITGHNGGARLFAGGGPGGPGPTNGQPPDGQPPDGSPQNLPPANGNPPINNNQPGDGNNQPNNMPPGLAGGSETGDKGIGRLFNQQLAGQISWFLPFALFSFVLVFAGGGLRWPLDARQHQVLFWLAWLLPMVIFFSFAGLFHRYYLEMLAPAIAALTAVGLLALWQKYNQPGWQGWLLPLGIAGTVATHAFIIAAFPEWSQWLTPVMLIGSLGTAVLLLVIRYWQLDPVRAPRSSLFAPILFTAALAALLLAPAIWSYTPIWFGGDTGLPYAGPELQRGRPFFTANNNNNTITTPGLNRELLTYLTENYQGETFLVAGSNARTVAPYILATDYAAMAMGGFSGGDSILTADSLSQLIANDEVRFFLVSEQNGPGGGPNGRGSDLTTWITQNCTAVSLQATTPAPNNNGPRPAESPQQLFDCQS